MNKKIIIGIIIALFISSNLYASSEYYLLRSGLETAIQRFLTPKDYTTRAGTSQVQRYLEIDLLTAPLLSLSRHVSDIGVIGFSGGLRNFKGSMDDLTFNSANVNGFHVKLNTGHTEINVGDISYGNIALWSQGEIAYLLRNLFPPGFNLSSLDSYTLTELSGIPVVRLYAAIIKTLIESVSWTGVRAYKTASITDDYIIHAFGTNAYHDERVAIEYVEALFLQLEYVEKITNPANYEDTEIQLLLEALTKAFIASYNNGGTIGLMTSDTNREIFKEMATVFSHFQESVIYSLQNANLKGLEAIYKSGSSELPRRIVELCQQLCQRFGIKDAESVEQITNNWRTWIFKAWEGGLVTFKRRKGNREWELTPRDKPDQYGEEVFVRKF